MSAAALRAPARWWDAVRAQIIVLESVHPAGWVTVVLFFALFTGGDAVWARDEDPPFNLFRLAVVMMFLLPLAWQGRGGRAGDTPLPIADTCRTLVRVLAGAVFAGLVLGLGIGLYVLFGRWRAGSGTNLMNVFPASYPVALTVAGVAHYLLGAALMLRAERPGRVLLAGFCVGALVLGAAGIELERVEFDSHGTLDSPQPTGSTTLTLPAALLRLALGVAAVCATVWWDGPRAKRWRGWTRFRTRFPEPASTRSVPLTVPRPRPPAATVFARHLLLLAPRMALPLLLIVYYAWVLAPGDVVHQSAPSWMAAFMPVTRVISPEPLEILMFTGFAWPVLVWLDERQIGPWDDAHPVDTLSRRLLHAAAGLVWLQLVGLVIGAAFVSRAVRAAMLSSPTDLPAWLWPGLPIALLVLYCLGTLATVGARNPVMAGVFGTLLLVPALGILQTMFSGFHPDAEPGPLAPTRLLTAVGWSGHQTEHWSTPVALLWTPVFVALATLAIWARAWREQHGWSPSLLEIIRHRRRVRAELPT